jgi:hypothetical protein
MIPNGPVLGNKALANINSDEQLFLGVIFSVIALLISWMMIGTRKTYIGE